MKALLPLLYLMAFVMLLSACDGDEPSPCPEVNQPPIQTLNQWEKARFPYGEFDTLVFVIEEPEIGRQDTVKLGRIHYDSSVVNHGDSTIRESRCKKAFTRRTQLFTAIYGADYKDRLTFTNDEDVHGIKVLWEGDKSGIDHGKLEKLLGEKNDLIPSDEDTIVVKGIVYNKAMCVSHKTIKIGGDVMACYSFSVGFAFIHDKRIKKKWSLLEAY